VIHDRGVEGEGFWITTAELTEGRRALRKQSNERSEWQRRGWRYCDGNETSEMAITRIAANGAKMEEDRKSETGSPLDVEGVNLGVSTAEIVDMVRESRARYEVRP
jgi:hypothetical protein